MIARHLIVFARVPRLGQVKKRLAAGIGDLAALIFYRRALEALLRRLGRGRWHCWIATTPARARHRGWPRPWRSFVQESGDLGRRMGRAMASRPAGPTIVVGSDIPEIEIGHIEAAFRALGQADAVFGPAADGGYWLVGCRRRPPIHGLFARVRWSSAHALADTMSNLRGRRAVVLGAVLDDIDDANALLRWRRRRRG
ncbi:MAG: glycosyltransferase [Alphaproteobacteria bacterium]|nr:glycosyltransferase [Alphaproteobacteria bacterium]